MNNAPALISIAYVTCGGHTAELQLRNNNEPTRYLTILHENTDDCAIHDLPGGLPTSLFSVSDKETLTLLVREESAIVACAILEVDMASVENIGSLLIPRAISNMILEQNETTVFVEDVPRETLETKVERMLEVLEVR